MINYSIVKRSVNANLIEINQAKSRINQAKKEGKTPQPAVIKAIKQGKENVDISKPASPSTGGSTEGGALRLAAAPITPRVVAALRPKAVALVTENNF